MSAKTLTPNAVNPLTGSKAVGTATRRASATAATNISAADNKESRTSRVFMVNEHWHASCQRKVTTLNVLSGKELNADGGFAAWVARPSDGNRPSQDREEFAERSALRDG